MVTLTEQVDIPASFERLCLWADNFEEEFVKWSPYHIECPCPIYGVFIFSFFEKALQKREKHLQ